MNRVSECELEPVPSLREASSASSLRPCPPLPVCNPPNPCVTIAPGSSRPDSGAATPVPEPSGTIAPVLEACIEIMLRRAFLYLSQQKKFQQAMLRFHSTRTLASRFVAGDSLAEAVQAAAA